MNVSIFFIYIYKNVTCKDEAQCQREEVLLWLRSLYRRTKKKKKMFILN